VSVLLYGHEPSQRGTAVGKEEEESLDK
jgi:hypothetical protein